MPDPLKPITAANPASGQAPQLTPTVADLIKVCPDASKNNLTKYFPYIAKAMAAGGLTTRNQLIAIISTIYTETRQFNPIPEAGKGGGKYGNFYGRGFVQLSHEDNYRAASKYLGIDLIANPDRALEPEIAAKLLVWFWKGGSGGTNIAPYAEKSDWANCRSIVNAGHPGAIASCWGREVYFPTIERAIATFQSGIDPNAAGAATLPGDYGLNCVDTGGAPERNLAGMHNPSTQLDALSYALGIHQLDNQRSHTFHAILDVAAQPDILKLDAQLTFEGKGFGVDLDGEYTVDEIVFYFGDTLEAELTAYKPDPNAPQPQVFLHDANADANSGMPQPAVGNVPASEIGRKIYEAAQAAYGSSTVAGPERGNKACAWSINNLVLPKAGIHTIGSSPDSVASVEAALKSGRGQLVEPRNNCQPGDIIVMANHHIGICMSAGGSEVLSNSSSKATFTWKAPIEKYDGYYSVTSKAYRVVS